MNGRVIGEITELRRRMNDLSDLLETELCSVGFPPGVRYDKLRVQSSPENRMEASVVKIEMLRHQLWRLQDRIDAKKALIEAFQTQSDIFTNSEWNVFKMRYFDGKTYEQIEHDSGFSFRKVRRLIQNIRKKMKSFP